LNNSVLISLLTAIVSLSIAFNSDRAFAMPVTGLHSASVEVASQQDDDRSAAFTIALNQVLIKVSGDESSLLTPGLNAMLNSPEVYVQTYSYRDNPGYLAYLQFRLNQDPRAQSAEKQTFEQPLPYILDVSFSAESVENKMNSFGLPIWGAVRPSILMWVVSEQNGERKITSSSDSAVTDVAETVAQQRGLPIYFPVVDLADISAVDIDELWGLFPESVESASRRYAPDVVVMVRLVDIGGDGWSGDWLVRTKQEMLSGSRSGVDLLGLWQGLLAQVSSNLASRYAVRKSGERLKDYIDISVSNVSTFKDYARLKKYLQALPPVSTSMLSWVNRGEVGYRIELAGTRDQFYEHIALGKGLVPQLRNLINTSGPAVESDPLLLEQEGAGSTQLDREPESEFDVELRLFSQGSQNNTTDKGSLVEYFSWDSVGAASL